MLVVSMLQAKASLSLLVKALEQGKEREIMITRNGRPVAKLVPIGSTASNRRIGVAKRLFEVPEDTQAVNNGAFAASPYPSS